MKYLYSVCRLDLTQDSNSTFTQVVEVVLHTVSIKTSFRSTVSLVSIFSKTVLLKLEDTETVKAYLVSIFTLKLEYPVYLQIIDLYIFWLYLIEHL